MPVKKKDCQVCQRDNCGKTQKTSRKRAHKILSVGMSGAVNDANIAQALSAEIGRVS